MTVEPEAVRAQLERVLASETFANAGRHSRLLRYVAERTLAGEGDQLKEYVLGTEVFDRADSYDPRIDTIVRVEARRLRQRLDEYYAKTGSADPVVISIPRGTYVPTFERRQVSPDQLAPVAIVATGRTRRSWMPWIAGSVLLVTLIAAVSFLGPPTESAAERSATPAVAVLPIQTYSTERDDQLLAARLTDAILTELARSKDISVASRASTAHYTDERRPVAEIRQALQVDFVLEATLDITGDNIHLIVRLVDAELDRKVWVGQYDATRGQAVDLAQRIGPEAVTSARQYHARRRS